MSEAVGAPQDELVAAAPLSPAAFPCVDLLPESVRAAARARVARLVAFGAVGAAVAAVGGLYVLAGNDRAAAADQLDAASATETQLQHEAARYAQVPVIRAQLDEVQQQITAAMGSEVRFSFLLNDLSLLTPADVALSEVSLAVSAPDTSGAAAGATASAGVGTATFTGEARAYDGVAAWLDSLARQKVWIDPFATQLQRQAVAGAPGGALVTFTSTATLTDAALSHRFDQSAE